MKKIEEILQDLFPDKGDKFAESDDFINDGLLDSLSVLDISMAMEDEYGITFGGSELMPQNFASLESMRELLEEHDITGV